MADEPVTNKKGWLATADVRATVTFMLVGTLVIAALASVFTSGVAERMVDNSVLERLDVLAAVAVGFLFRDKVVPK